MTTENIQTRLDKDQFWSAEPFPHLVLDDFLPNDISLAAAQVFPTKKDFAWTPYLHFNELKYGFSKAEQFPIEIKQIIDLLHSDVFCKKLAYMVGAEKLLPDPLLVGGGLHQTFRNGFLNIHTDFSHHPHKKQWKRKLNLLFYLNKDWPSNYEGNLEFWDIETKKCIKQIQPILNRAVIFLTDSTSLHGSPKRLKCKKGESRKSIALYYYEEITQEATLHATHYYSDTTKPWTKGIIRIENVLLKLFLRLRFLFKLRH